MIIGMILDKEFPPDSRVENEALSLIEDGHKVFLFCLQYGGQKDVEVINAIEVRRYHSSKLIFKLSALAYTFPFYRMLTKPLLKNFFKTVKPDVIHVHDMQIAKAVFDLQFHVPVILDLHENRPAIMRYYGHVNSWKGKLLIKPDRWEKAQKKLIGRADKVIVVTEEAKNDIIKYGNKKEKDVVVVPNTIHPNIYGKYEVDQNLVDRFSKTFNVLYLGDTAIRRGTDNAIYAIKILKDSIKNIRLILVGCNRVEDHILKELVNRLELNDYVLFEGWQDVSLFPSYVMASDICISPLKRNLHHDTTFANKLFQYMAMGKPVVVSDSTAQANVVVEESCGLIHKANDPNDLASKIMEVYNNPVQAKEYGSNGQLAVNRKWNWKITSKSLLNLYKNML